MDEKIESTTGKKPDRTVLIVSAVIVVLFTAWGLVLPDNLAVVINTVNGFLCNDLGWLYLLAMMIFLFFGFYIALSKYGNLKMGKPDDEPEFSNFQWFALLFGGGIGIGLVFWSMAEPMMHASGLGGSYSSVGFENAPVAALTAAELTAGDFTTNIPVGVIDAIRITFMHEGVHCWGIFGLVGMCLGYAAYRKGLPFLVSSTLYPLIGDRIYGGIGKTVDILAVFATVFGVATSLGLGAMQIAGGVEYVYGVEGLGTNSMVIAMIIGVITAIFTLATVAGLEKAMSAVVNFKVWLSIFFMVFLLVFGGTTFILREVTWTLGSYITTFMNQSFWYGDTAWLSNWTVFYWGWWIAWGTFCGTFFARVSKGRTLRQMFLGGTLLPAGFSFVWIVIFAGAAFFTNSITDNSVVAATQAQYTTATFAVLQQLPIYQVMAPLTLVLIVICFVGAADSATFVLPMLTFGGTQDPSKAARAGWGIAQGAVTVILILVSGSGALVALQTASVVAALPFMVVVAFMCIALARQVAKDYRGDEDPTCWLDERAEKKKLKEAQKE
ncbi:MAG TPA: glycine/betaine ABC transporter permease [Eggerthellaceae bacterium]|nr:glycine/betaine ABC transporter permease [Eggerthellaceae bacterium]